MELRQIAALLAVADHGSFTAAAAALHTVQSNVSTHVANLERELGVVLVDRGVGRLTAEGEAVVRRARRVQGELDALTADVAALRDEITGEVRLGVIGTTARWLMPHLFAALDRRLPAVRLLVLEASTTSLIPQLVAGSLELAVVNLPVEDPDVDTEPLFDEDVMLVAPSDHPLAASAEVDVAELAGHPLLLPGPGTALRSVIDDAARERGVELEARAEIDGIRLLATLAFEGFGAAVLPASAAPMWLEGDWRRVHLVGARRRTVGLAHRRRGLASAPMKAVEQELRSVVTDRLRATRGLHPAGE